MQALVVVENFVRIETRRANGSIVESYKGPSEGQLKFAHEVGVCGSDCGWCYAEAEEYLAARAA